MDTRELLQAAATIAAGMVTGTKGQLDPGTIMKVAETAVAVARQIEQEGRKPLPHPVRP